MSCSEKQIIKLNPIRNSKRFFKPSIFDNLMLEIDKKLPYNILIENFKQYTPVVIDSY